MKYSPPKLKELVIFKPTNVRKSPYAEDYEILYGSNMMPINKFENLGGFNSVYEVKEVKTLRFDMYKVILTELDTEIETTVIFSATFNSDEMFYKGSRKLLENYIDKTLTK